MARKLANELTCVGNVSEVVGIDHPSSDIGTIRQHVIDMGFEVIYLEKVRGENGIYEFGIRRLNSGGLENA